MQAGKLPQEFLSKLLAKIDIKDPRVFLGPKLGEDAALIDFADRYLVAKTDPITFATDRIGSYLVQVNANDLAVMGATPKWLMATLLFPEDTPPEMAELIFDQVLQACATLGITLVGGHTEVTYDLPRPIAVGVLLGEVDKDQVVLSSGAIPGDCIVLTKGIAIEGTTILAREVPDALRKAGVGESTLKKAQDLLFNPGISIVRDATITRSVVKVHAMHDPTEGGLATGLLEMATASNVGLMINKNSIPILTECEQICQAIDLDPLGLIASGALLAAVDPSDVPMLINSLGQASIYACEIGHIVSPEEGFNLNLSSGVQRLPNFERDELARYLGQ